MNYEIFTDSSCNLDDKMIEELGVNIVSLVYVVEDKEYISYVKGVDSDLKSVYSMLREKKNITTSCVNQDSFQNAFEATLKEGKDILYIGFSSGLSLTYQNAVFAMNELKDKYPERKIVCVDTLSASMGEGLVVYLACNKKKEGASLEEVAQFVEDIKLKVVHYFTVEDLYWLYKGGRVSKTSYYIASAVKIKPLLHVDNEGKLIAVGKAIGRKKSLMWVADKIASAVGDKENATVFISHGDCIEDVEFVKAKIKDKANVANFAINYIDPVVGAHSGPGTIAIFTVGDKRD